MESVARRRWGRAAGAAVVSVLMVGGAVLGAGSAPGQASALAYTCGFPAGPGPAGVGVAAAFPERGSVDAPITPGEVTVTAALPRDALPGAVSVAGTARLTTTVTHNTESATAPWGGLEVLSAPVPDAGDLVLTASGPVAPVTVGKPGEVAFAAGDLAFDLVVRSADGSAELSVGCALDAGQGGVLATVTVPDDKDAPPGSSAPESPAENAPGGGIEVGPAPGPAAGASPKAVAEIPPECGNIPLPPRGRVGCTYVTGYSTIAKLNGSIRIEPGLTNVGIARPVLEIPFLRADNPAELVGGRFPPSQGAFLAFGFMPISASMELIQVGPMNIHTEGLAVAPFTYSVTATSQLTARIFDAKVNGVPLDLGPNCRTVRPIDVVLTGGTPQYTDILKGGPLSGTVEIPAFTGCGARENLDPLLTGLVSGPGNRVKVLQGTLCVPADPRSPCPPGIPQPPPPGSF